MVVSNVSNPNHQWFFEMIGNCNGTWLFFCWFSFLFKILFVKIPKRKISETKSVMFVVYIPKKYGFVEWDGETCTGFHGVSRRRSAALQGNPRSEGVLCKWRLVFTHGGPPLNHSPPKEIPPKKFHGFHQLNNLRPRPLKITYSIENADEDEEVGEFIRDFWWIKGDPERP